jgi:hypothetical protein
MTGENTIATYAAYVEDVTHMDISMKGIDDD